MYDGVAFVETQYRRCSQEGCPEAWDKIFQTGIVQNCLERVRFFSGAHG
jgi:hypothetical protein